eukprot:c22974_g1_i1 orf=44-343(+)
MHSPLGKGSGSNVHQVGPSPQSQRRENEGKRDPPPMYNCSSSYNGPFFLFFTNYINKKPNNGSKMEIRRGRSEVKKSCRGKKMTMKQSETLEQAMAAAP